ncbi:MICOS complex subunit MIC10 [Cornus florida]|uniref:MICOS complex subunit MIC10 n=1 Tax=Cornus florida TaxID=4283 RepID=UPI00289C7C03|nr:MICOS complex subunit MIC10 [Cornus florida]
MSENKPIPPEFDLNAKWDACLDLSIRKIAYSSLAGAFGGLLLLRSPVTRWAAVAFGAGVGVGAAYTECNYKYYGVPVHSSPTNVSESSPSPDAQD